MKTQRRLRARLPRQRRPEPHAEPWELDPQLLEVEPRDLDPLDDPT